MSRVFGVVRGSFYIESGGGQEIKPSIIKITGIDLPSEGALVTNFTMNDTEKATITQCFNNVNHIYAFGHDPDQSVFSVSYLVFLGSGCMTDDEGFKDSGNLSDIVQKYNNVKISNGASVDVTFGEFLSVVGIVLSVNVAVYEAELNSVVVTVAGKSLITNAKPKPKSGGNG